MIGGIVSIQKGRRDGVIGRFECISTSGGPERVQHLEQSFDVQL